MRFISLIPFLLGTSLAVPTSQSFSVAPSSLNGTLVAPGSPDDIVITAYNTLNGTYHSNETYVADNAARSAAAAIGIDLVNNFGDGAKAYIVGKDTSNRIVFVGADGNFIYPSSGGSPSNVPIDNVAIALPPTGQSLHVNIPGAISSGRIWFSESDLHFFIHNQGAIDSLVQPNDLSPTDPNAGIVWGFVEFTFNPDGSIYANLSYVDLVGLPASMTLKTSDGSPDQVIDGLPNEAINAVTLGLMGVETFTKLAMYDGKRYLRVLSPNRYLLIDSSQLVDWFADYINNVYSHYSTNTLTIDTQGEGRVDCHVSGDVMRCDGSDREYAKPSSVDIWGCNSGPFVAQNGGNIIHQKIVPRLCAAFYRTTLLLNGGNLQPSLPASSYYPGITYTKWNAYARAIHQFERDGKGYAFSYDDVNPSGENAAGVVSSPRPQSLTVYVGASYKFN